MALPVMSDEQRAAALARAKEIRSDRAAVKASMKAGHRDFASVMADIDNPVIGNMRTLDAIAAMPGYGKKTAAKLMSEIGIDSKRRLSGLGSRQKEALLSHFA